MDATLLHSDLGASVFVSVSVSVPHSSQFSVTLSSHGLSAAQACIKPLPQSSAPCISSAHKFSSVSHTRQEAYKALHCFPCAACDQVDQGMTSAMCQRGKKGSSDGSGLCKELPKIQVRSGWGSMNVGMKI